MLAIVLAIALAAACAARTEIPLPTATATTIKTIPNAHTATISMMHIVKKNHNRRSHAR